MHRAHRTATGRLATVVGMSLSLHSAVVCAQTRPNIVLITSDDAGYADFGFMDQFTGRQTKFKTPSLDQLAAEGVRASNAYAAASICALSRAGMMTGRYPSTSAQQKPHKTYAPNS